MNNFYTNVQVYGNKILLSEYKDGKKSRRKLDYFPSIFVPSKETTEFKDIHGNYLGEVKPGTIKETRDFISKYKDLNQFKIYGNQRFEYSYIAENYRDKHITWNYDLITICQIDIEVGSSGGYASPENPFQPITTLSMRFKQGSSSVNYVFGYKEDYTPKNETVKYIKCEDELDLLKKFINHWSKNYPDVITGWYVKHFDIPYLIKRIESVLGETSAKRLSPWNFYAQKYSIFMNKEQIYYSLWGIAILDYMELYKKFAIGGASQESYKLDNIALVELELQKLDFGEYDNLNELYENNYEKFVDYNIWDVELIDKLDNKLKLIELALTLAYDAKVNYEDIFMQVRMWDILIYNKLLKDNIIIPPKETQHREEYMGGFVKEPQVGMHKWLVSYDVTSMYPMNIQQYNIGSDSIVSKSKLQNMLKSSSISKKEAIELLLKNMDENSIVDKLKNIDSFLENKIDVRLIEACRTLNFSICPNGSLFDNLVRSFLSVMMEEMFEDRSRYKKLMIDAKKELEKVNEEIKKRRRD